MTQQKLMTPEERGQLCAATGSPLPQVAHRTFVAQVRAMKRVKIAAYVVTIFLAPGSVILAASVRPFT